VAKAKAAKAKTKGKKGRGKKAPAARRKTHPAVRQLSKIFKAEVEGAQCGRAMTTFLMLRNARSPGGRALPGQRVALQRTKGQLIRRCLRTTRPAVSEEE
jgi:hypothetical protein